MDFKKRIKPCEVITLYQHCKNSWNAGADEFNQWDSLSESEKVEFAYQLGADDCLDTIL